MFEPPDSLGGAIGGEAFLAEAVGETVFDDEFTVLDLAAGGFGTVERAADSRDAGGALAYLATGGCGGAVGTVTSCVAKGQSFCD